MVRVMRVRGLSQRGPFLASCTSVHDRLRRLMINASKLLTPRYPLTITMVIIFHLIPILSLQLNLSPSPTTHILLPRPVFSHIHYIFAVSPLPTSHAMLASLFSHHASFLLYSTPPRSESERLRLLISSCLRTFNARAYPFFPFLSTLHAHLVIDIKVYLYVLHCCRAQSTYCFYSGTVTACFKITTVFARLEYGLEKTSGHQVSSRLRVFGSISLAGTIARSYNYILRFECTIEHG